MFCLLNFRHLELRKIEESSFERYKTFPFGNQNVQSLQICSMLRKQNDGYYEILHEEELKFVTANAS